VARGDQSAPIYNAALTVALPPHTPRLPTSEKAPERVLVERGYSYQGGELAAWAGEAS
jgi:hypothetical protein